MVQRDEIRQRVDRILTTEFNIQKEILSAKADLFDDLHLDSLELVSFVDNLETTFDLQIDRDFLRDTRTLGDVYARLEQILQ